MAVTSTYHEGLAFDLGTGAHADDLEALAVAVVDTLDHVRNQGTAEAVSLARDALGARGGNHDGVVFLADADAVGQGAFQFALGTFDLDGQAVEGHGHLVGDGNGVFTNT